MARIRAVHPDLPSDRKLANVSRDARYTYVLTWCIADDKGLFRAEPRQLLGQLYPHDPEIDGSHLEAWLSDLVSIGVLRWRADRAGARIGELVNWPKRQKIDKPSKSYLEGELITLAGGSQLPREPVAAESRLSRETLAPGSLEYRALNPEPRVVADDDDRLARVSRIGELRDRLPSSAHNALDGYLRAATDPAAVVATILAEGPDTGTNAAAGKTWEHIGQALLDLRAASEPFKPVAFRAFVERAQRDGGRQLGTDAEQMRRARERLAREGAA